MNELNKAALQKLISFREVFVPPVERLYSFEPEESIMMPYSYGNEISGFINAFYEAGIVAKNYTSIQEEASKNYLTDGWIENLSLDKTCAFLTLIIRKDRFVDGFIASMIENGTVNKLLNRLEQLVN